MFGGHANFIGEGGAVAAHLATADFARLFVTAEIDARLAERAVNLLDFFVGTNRPTRRNPAPQRQTITDHLPRQTSL